jgi:hypothetical protein
MEMKIEELVEAMVEARLKQVQADEQYENLRRQACQLRYSGTQSYASPSKVETEKAVEVIQKPHKRNADGLIGRQKRALAIRNTAKELLYQHGRFDAVRQLGNKDTIAALDRCSDNLSDWCGSVRRGAGRSATRLAVIVCAFTSDTEKTVEKIFEDYKRISAETYIHPQEGTRCPISSFRKKCDDDNSTLMSNEEMFGRAYHAFSGELPTWAWEVKKDELIYNAINRLETLVSNLT